MRRVKTYLRSTMSQEHLNSDKEKVDKLDLVEVANSFVAANEHRQTLFGKF